MSRTFSSALLLLFTLVGIHQWLHYASAAGTRGGPMYDRPAGPYRDPAWYEEQERIAAERRDVLIAQKPAQSQTLRSALGETEEQIEAAAPQIDATPPNPVEPPMTEGVSETPQLTVNPADARPAALNGQPVESENPVDSIVELPVESQPKAAEQPAEQETEAAAPIGPPVQEENPTPATPSDVGAPTPAIGSPSTSILEPSTPVEATPQVPVESLTPSTPESETDAAPSEDVEPTAEPSAPATSPLVEGDDLLRSILKRAKPSQVGVPVDRDQVGEENAAPLNTETVEALEPSETQNVVPGVDAPKPEATNREPAPFALQDPTDAIEMSDASDGNSDTTPAPRPEDVADREIENEPKSIRVAPPVIRDPRKAPRLIQPPVTRHIESQPPPLKEYIGDDAPSRPKQAPPVVKSPEPSPLFTDEPVGTGIRKLEPEPPRVTESSPALRSLRDALKAAEKDPEPLERVLSSLRGDRNRLRSATGGSTPALEAVEPESSRRNNVSANAELNDRLVKLRRRIRETLAVYYHDMENVATRTPWGVMHAMLPFGVDSELIVDGRRVNSIGWLCWNGECRGERMLYTEGGYLRAKQGPNLQGHRGQFLAMLAQAKVKRDYELRVDGQRFTVQDLVRHEMATCKPGSELTFKLIGLVHYLDSDTRWSTADGERWSIGRLIEEELDRDVHNAACGGVHRLMGLAYAVNRRQKRGEPIDGLWQEAQQRVQEYRVRVRSQQNPDGSLSTNWFRERGADIDVDRRLQTTGHLLEWLLFSLPEEKLRDERILDCVEYLEALMRDNVGREWSVGPKGHALRALSLFDERVFGAKPGHRKAIMAKIAEELVR